MIKHLGQPLVLSALALVTQFTVGIVPPCCGADASASGFEFVDDEVQSGKRALSSKRFPWYDSARDGLRPIEIPDVRHAASSDRAEVPMRKQRPQNRNPAPATTLTNLWGLDLVSWSLIAVMIVVLMGLLLWAFLRLESSSQKAGATQETPESKAKRIKQLPFTVEDTHGDFRRLAAQAEAQGDFRNAIVFLFSHTLLALDERGLVRLRRGKTNRQYLRELSGHTKLAGYFQQVMILFESAFFGGHNVESSDFKSCWNHLTEFEEGIERVS